MSQENVGAGVSRRLGRTCNADPEAHLTVDPRNCVGQRAGDMSNRPAYGARFRLRQRSRPSEDFDRLQGPSRQGCLSGDPTTTLDRS